MEIMEDTKDESIPVPCTTTKSSVSRSVSYKSGSGERTGKLTSSILRN